MNKKRVRELRQIAERLYDNLLDNMGVHKYGHVSAGVEELVVLAEIAEKINIDLADWVEKEHLTD